MPSPSNTTRAWLALLRPANVATALADVLAGTAVAAWLDLRGLPWLLLSTACLYAGGVVLNDVFDRELDRVERPERPIPSGRVRPSAAAALGAALLGAGILAASAVNRTALLVAGALAALVLLYDAWGKRHWLIGPINMGLCRALNLLLGVASLPAALRRQWPVALIPFAYIVAVTALSRGEVHGGRAATATFALISLSAALAGLAFLAIRSEHALLAGAVLALLIWRVVPAFARARRTPDAGLIRRAVRTGVLSLVLVNAVIGTAFGGPVFGAWILATALLAAWLARGFAVT